MAKPTESTEVEHALRKTGTGWFLDKEGQAGILEEIAIEIDEFMKEYKKRFSFTPDPFGLVNANPEKAAAFFELYTDPPVSMDMQIAAWELINGADIQSMQFAYHRDQGISLILRLITEHRPEAIEFRGTTLRDFKLTRHFGILSVGGKEMFDGYYAFQLRD